MIGLPHLESLSIDRTRPRCARHRCTSRACRYRGLGLAHDHGIRIAAHGLRFRCRQLNLRRPERGSGVRHCCSDGRPGSLTRRIRQLLGPGHRQIQSLWPNPACVLRNCTGRAREGMPNLFHRRRHPPASKSFRTNRAHWVGAFPSVSRGTWRASSSRIWPAQNLSGALNPSGAPHGWMAHPVETVHRDKGKQIIEGGFDTPYREADRLLEILTSSYIRRIRQPDSLSRCHSARPETGVEIGKRVCRNRRASYLSPYHRG